jgi:hypothetical protein
MKKLLVLMIAVIFTLVSACTTRITDFTIISSKNVDLSKMASFKRGKERITNEDRIWNILFIPTGVPNLKTAIDKAIEGTPGCVAMVDGVVSTEQWYFLIGSSAYIIEGTPLIDPSLASSTEVSKYNLCVLDENGNVKEYKKLTKEEYDAEKAKM